MDNTKCFLTDETDCDLIDVTVNDSTYYVSEDLADELPLKKLRAKITDKVEKDKKEAEEKEAEAAKKRLDALSTLKGVIGDLGISKEDLAALLLGQKPEEAAAVAELTAAATRPAKQANTAPTKLDEGFKAVSGDLKGSSSSAALGDGVSASMPAYASVNDGDGKSVQEEGKTQKIIDNGSGTITRSNLGTTIIKVSGHDNGLNKMLQQTDAEGNLIRSSALNGQGAGRATTECPLCRGSGITRIGAKTCPKCEGVGIVNL